MSLEDTNNRTEQLMLTVLAWFLSILAAVSVLIGLAALVIAYLVFWPAKKVRRRRALGKAKRRHREEIRRIQERYA